MQFSSSNTHHSQLRIKWSMCFGTFLEVWNYGQVSDTNETWKPSAWPEGIKGQWTSSAQSFHFYSATNCGVSIPQWFWWHLTLWRQCLPTLSCQRLLRQVSEKKVSCIQCFPRGEEYKSSPGKHPIPCSVLEQDDAYSLQLLTEKELSRPWALGRAIPPFSASLSQEGPEVTCNSSLFPFCILGGTDFPDLSFHPN